jgi:hypothetical protein
MNEEQAMGIAAAVPVDTYEVNSVPVESEDALAEFRQQVKTDDGRAKMSEAAKAKLRSLNDHDRANTLADGRLVTEFNSRPWALEPMMDLFAKSFGGPQSNPRRRAVKALHRLAQGLRVYHIHDVAFLGELLPDEVEMPMVRFLSRYPLPEDEIVTPKGGSEKPVRLCKAGQKCLRYAKRKPAPAKGSGDYCSTACSASGRARAKRASAAIPTVQ